MRWRVFRWAGLSTVLAAALAVSACGAPAGSKPAAQIVPEMQNAANTATSMHVSGTLKSGSQTVTIDVSLKGVEVAGYLGAYGTRFYVLSLNGQSYVKLNAGYLNLEKAPASLCATICGKYVQLPALSGATIASVVTMQGLISQVIDSSDMKGLAGSGCTFSPATRGGQPVLECRQGSAAIDVAAQGQPYLVYLSGNGQHLTFSHWNSVVLPAAPPASQVVSANALN
jgi:hypothetical protein